MNTQAVNTETVSGRATLRPAVDIFENKDAFLLVVDMPGVTREQIEVDLEQDILTITGERDVAIPEGARVVAGAEEGWLYRRQFTISQDIDAEKVKAEFNDGVLEVYLPRHERTKPRRIQVDVSA